MSVTLSLSNPWGEKFFLNSTANFNELFHKNLEPIQYKAAIAIREAVRSTSSENRFQELDLESLKSRR